MLCCCIINLCDLIWCVFVLANDKKSRKAFGLYVKKGGRNKGTSIFPKNRLDQAGGQRNTTSIQTKNCKFYRVEGNLFQSSFACSRTLAKQKILTLSSSGCRCPRRPRTRRRGTSSTTSGATSSKASASATKIIILST